MAEIESTGSEEGRAEGDPLSGQEEVRPVPANLTANVSDERMYSWGSQAAQYPPSGPPGISYFRGEVSDEIYVDCLLYRDESGELVGILNRYAMDIPPHERAGDQNIWVHPNRRRQGIGSALAAEASRRWSTIPTEGFRDPEDLKLTDAGVKWVEGLLEKRSIAYVLPAPPDVIYNEWWDPEGMRGWIWPRPGVATRIEIDPREGGNYRIDVDEKGLALSVTGHYVAFERPRGLAFTWHCTTWEPSEPETIVVVQLEPHEEGRTLMTIRHLRLAPDLQDAYKARWERVAAQLEEKLARR